MKAEELFKILLTNKPSDLLRQRENELFELIPELEKCKGFDQHNPWHVYDVLEVGDENKFYANDIPVHNCEFIGQSNSLIDANVIRQLLLDLENVTYKFTVDSDIRFYEDLKPNLKYIIGVDTSMGVDGDFSAIQVFSFPDMVQVAEWQSDRLNQNLQVEKLKALTDYMYDKIREKGNRHPEIYWSLENNGSGEGFICALREKGDVHYIKRATIINERGKYEK